MQPERGDGIKDEKRHDARIDALGLARKDGWRSYEWFSAIVICAAAIVLHAVFLTHAGGLWRDEAGLVRMATLPSWREVWKMLFLDHCPMLVPVLVRFWSQLGWGDSDFGVRMLGLSWGLFLLVSLFAAGRIMRRGTPFLALGLVAVNVLVVRFGDSLRAYGLGSALNVLGLALMWRAAKKPGLGNLLWAALVAVFSVQCLYQNAVFVFAGCCGAFVICVMEGRWRDTLRIAGIGLIAAVSLIPYVAPIRSSQTSWAIHKTGFSLAASWDYLLQLIGVPFPQVAWLWVGLGVLALCVAGLAVRNAGSTPERGLVLFSAVALITGFAGFVAFLESAQLHTGRWYFLPLLTFVVTCLDAILADWRWWMTPATATFALCMSVAACVVSTAGGEMPPNQSGSGGRPADDAGSAGRLHCG